MIRRFTGENGHRLLVEAILRQSIIYGDTVLASKVANLSELILCDSSFTLIEQSNPENDLYLIITGKFSVIVNGREIATRKAGEHIGEMALIDPTKSRCASVSALEPSIVAKITEASFTSLADEYPKLWRGLARELSEKLRQRNNLVRERNKAIRVFIGSSTETLTIANEIQAGLAHDPYIVNVWTNDVFGVSKYSLEALEEAANKADFAVLVLGSDDTISSRGKDLDAPRDNVIFELGLFMGALGRRRVFIVIPRGKEIKIPTDLLGINHITYALDDPKHLSAKLGHVCTELRKIINDLGAL